MSALARLAADEYRRRKASVDAAVADRRFDRAEGEKLLRCWLSIALTAGARPADCDALLGYWQEERKLTDVYARYILLEQGPKRKVWQAELTRARDAAGGKARAAAEDIGWEDRRTLDLSLRHHALDSLAIYLGCPSEFPIEEQEKEAA
ncbi:hypothetical protein [Qipengyuania huizhouensis]|uniref:hypothetical protein n=1 Tax=Qipengyuania huizhouensis TaxID=2867245 RepID=UPI001C88D1F9|nr:hypothetical protein [Qipengyuania huizhouensis]MBX7459526.1 hypothetical protein [Qipengyuania huizhouensis]